MALVSLNVCFGLEDDKCNHQLQNRNNFLYTPLKSKNLTTAEKKSVVFLISSHKIFRN